MIKIRNNSAVEIILGDYVIHPGINWIPKDFWDIVSNDLRIKKEVSQIEVVTE